jgi:hypothetical protein
MSSFTSIEIGTAAPAIFEGRFGLVSLQHARPRVTVQSGVHESAAGRRNLLGDTLL